MTRIRLDTHSRAAKKNTSHENEVLSQDNMYLKHRPCYQRGSLCQDPAGSRTTRRPPDHVKRRKLQWYGHVSSSSGLAKTILQGTVTGGRRQEFFFYRPRVRICLVSRREGSLPYTPRASICLVFSWWGVSLTRSVLKSVRSYVR